MSQNSITFTAGIAEVYEKYMAPIFFITTSLDLVNRITGKPEKILEIASGTGQLTRRLAEKFPGADITASEFNPGMMDVGKLIVKDKNVKWEYADACELPYENESFDLVICQFGFMFFPDKQKAVNEAYRVLKKGGTLLYNTWDKLESNRICYIADEVLKSVIPVDTPPFFHLPFSMYDENEMRSLAENAGFENIDIKKLDVRGYTSSPADVVKAFTEGNPVYLQIMERGAEKLNVFKEKLEERLIKEYGPGAFDIPLTEFIITSNK